MIFTFFFANALYAHDTTAEELVLRYRMLSQDFASGTQELRNIFSSFETVTELSEHTMAELNSNPNFLQSMQKFALSLNTLLNSLPSGTKKKEAIEAIITLFSEKFGSNDTTYAEPIKSLYKNHFVSLLKLNSSQESLSSVISIKGIQIKGNEVVKTIGTYGFWGFWFVTSTWTIVQLSPNVENFMYYPAFAIFIASGPFAISNQIWTQVFERIEKKAAQRQQTAVQYMKERLKSLKYKNLQWLRDQMKNHNDQKISQCAQVYR